MDTTRVSWQLSRGCEAHHSGFRQGRPTIFWGPLQEIVLGPPAVKSWGGEGDRHGSVCVGGWAGEWLVVKLAVVGRG